MPSHSITPGQVGAHAVTLTANTVETFTFADDLPEVTVVNHDGAAAVYFTIDGSTPTIAGPRTYVLPAVIGTATFAPPTPGGTVVKAISTGTPTISVQRAR